jgi:hypothetical protein
MIWARMGATMARVGASCVIAAVSHCRMESKLAGSVPSRAVVMLLLFRLRTDCRREVGAVAVGGGGRQGWLRAVARVCLKAPPAPAPAP